MHKLKYLPLAQKDLRNIISYIADKLKAPKAAIDLVDTLDERRPHTRFFRCELEWFSEVVQRSFTSFYLGQKALFIMGRGNYGGEDVFNGKRSDC